MLTVLLRGVCPRCSEGKVFRGVFRLNTQCPACSMSFKTDYTGARWMSYYVMLLMVFPVFGMMMLARVGLILTIGVSTVLMLLFTPVAVRLVTLACLYAEFRAGKR